MTRGPVLLALALLVAAIWMFAPHRFTDADTLSRLATGRYIVTSGEFPRHDPFTFAEPAAALGHPEWLGDVLAYTCYARLGEGGLQALVLVLVMLGFALAFACARELGAPPALALSLLLITLSASANRFAARNDIHALWLLPLFAWILLRHAARDRAWLGLLALGALWSNLHSSFVLGWALLLMALVERTLQREPLRALPVAVLIAYPLLPLPGPAGASAYAQLWDHLIGAAVYRGLITEWQSPLSSPAWLAILPLHVLTALGVTGIALARPRTRLLAVAMFALGALLVHGSRRFLPFMAVLMVPAVAGSAGAWSAALTRAVRRRAAAVLGVACAAYLALGMRSALRRPDVHVLARSDAPTRAARFLAAHAPAGAKLFNAFDDGPWLLWLTAPRIRHYVDPRNHLGAGFLQQYAREVLPSPARFEREVQRSGISFVLVRARDPRMQLLARRLAQANDWALVYWNGEHAVHARRVPANAAVIAGFGYHVLRPSFDPSYLAEPGRLRVAQAQLVADFDRLRAESATAAAAIEAALVVAVGGDQLDHAHAQRAARTLQSALATLPPSPELVADLERALAAARRE